MLTAEMRKNPTRMKHFAYYFINNLHKKYNNVQRVPGKTLIDFVIDYSNQNNLNLTFPTTNSVNAFIKAALVPICKESNVSYGQVVSSAVWTENGATVCGKAYNFGLLKISTVIESENVETLDQFHLFNNQKWLRENIEKKLQVLAEVDFDKFLKIYESAC